MLAVLVIWVADSRSEIRYADVGGIQYRTRNVFCALLRVVGEPRESDTSTY